jgi:hypothetical protein
MMFLTQKRLNRRTLLRGAGAAIALPMLDAMVPVRASAAKLVKAPLRTSFVYVPNGVVMDNWTPKTVGKEFEIKRILKPLERFRDRTLVISGLMDNNANALGDGGGDHARAAASFLTAAHPKKTGGADIHVGISVDQVIAQAIKAETRVPSLELGLDDSRVVGHYDSGYSCAYTNSISWLTPSTPLAPEANPRVIFNAFSATLTLVSTPPPAPAESVIARACSTWRAMRRKSFLAISARKTGASSTSIWDRSGKSSVASRRLKATGARSRPRWKSRPESPPASQTTPSCCSTCSSWLSKPT